MTQSQNLRTIATASAIAVAALAGIAASSGHANAAKNILYCEGSGRQMVRECCQTLVKSSGLPMWMRQSGRNCASAAIVCSVTKRPTPGVTRTLLSAGRSSLTLAAPPKPKIICKYVVMHLRDGGGNQTKHRDKPESRTSRNNSPNGRTAGKP